MKDSAPWSYLGPCCVNINILAPKMDAVRMGPNTQNDSFLANGFKDFD
jgi:hypothetical protein